MRKLLSLTLAVAMVLSLSAVAFAATDVSLDQTNIYADKEGTTIATSDGYTDRNAYVDDDKAYIYFTTQFFDDDIAKQMKVSAKWELGEEYVKSVDLVKEIDPDDKKAYYFIKVSFDFPEGETGTEDVIGTITLSTRAKASLGITAKSEEDFDFAITLANKLNDGNNAFGDSKVYDFKKDTELKDKEELEIELFKGEMGRFVVDTRGQDKLVIKSDVKYSEGIENVNPDIAYTYYNTNHPTFNKLGTLYINADAEDVLYELVDGKLVKSNAKYDEDEEAFVIRTRTIGSYVVAEKEIAAVEAPVAPVAPTNPSTGAAC